MFAQQHQPPGCGAYLQVRVKPNPGSVGVVKKTFGVTGFGSLDFKSVGRVQTCISVPQRRPTAAPLAKLLYHTTRTLIAWFNWGLASHVLVGQRALVCGPHAFERSESAKSVAEWFWFSNW
jgi:hypothetical protein